MRKILLFGFLMLFSCLLFANPISNVRAMQEGQKIVLLYDLESTAYVTDVEIRVDGKSRVVPLATLSGDVNREVMAGKNRRIEYDVLVDYVDGLRSDNISFVIISGAQAVDLGLSVKWASCNVGATKPEEYGDYFAWGEENLKSFIVGIHINIAMGHIILLQNIIMGVIMVELMIKQNLMHRMMRLLSIGVEHGACQQKQSKMSCAQNANGCGLH
ncbi:MAG: hypothetical protein IKV26_05910 [Paludibacteraceae bacterium]|nr:hypothetical protein [Paludibacteraceae bacterium]